jgi:hypothetical protein
LRIDSTSVVANPHAQVAVGILKLDLDALGSGMTKCVDQSLPANSINLMPDGWAQRLLPAGDNDAKVNIGLNGEFLLNVRQGQNQIQRARVRRAEVMNSVPALLYPLVHELKDSI